MSCLHSMKEVRYKLCLSVETLQPGVMFLCIGQETLNMSLNVWKFDQGVRADVNNDIIEDVLSCRAVPRVGVPLHDVTEQLVQAGRVQGGDGLSQVRDAQLLDYSESGERLRQTQGQLYCF